MTAADGRGRGRATGLGGYFNQLLVKTEAAAECVTALTRLSGGPSAFLFCLTRGGGRGGPLGSSETAEVAGAVSSGSH